MTDLELLHIITMPTRYQILMLLLDHHYCGKALSSKLGIPAPASIKKMRTGHRPAN